MPQNAVFGCLVLSLMRCRVLALSRERLGDARSLVTIGLVYAEYKRRDGWGKQLAWLSQAIVEPLLFLFRLILCVRSKPGSNSLPEDLQ